MEDHLKKNLVFISYGLNYKKDIDIIYLIWSSASQWLNLNLFMLRIVKKI